MITYKDCPHCGTRKIQESVNLCEVCETWEKAEQTIAAQDEILTRRYNEQLARAEQAEKERDEALARVQRLTELLEKEEALVANREGKLAKMSALVDSMQPSRPKRSMLAFVVELETTNGLRDTGKSQGEYFSVRGGTLVYIAKDACEVAAIFPDALAIRQIGIGYPRPA